MFWKKLQQKIKATHVQLLQKVQTLTDAPEGKKTFIKSH